VGRLVQRKEIAMPNSYFPPRTLNEALRIPKIIYERNSSKPMFRISLAEEMGLGSEGRQFRNLITASAGYGLTSGSYIAEKIELQQRGEELIKGNIDSAFEALFSIDVFQKFYDYFGTGGSKSVPSEKASKDFLEKESGIPSRQVVSALNNILTNARDWNLIQNIGGGEKFVPVELAKETTLTSLGSNSSEPTVQGKATPPEKLIPPTDIIPPTVDVSPKLQLNIEIHIAAETPDDKIEIIFKNMKKYLLSK
jgi:hypothetical protein